MTQWGLDTLFNPAKRHMDEEKRRLQSTREEIGDSSGGRRIDLESGKVTINTAEPESEDPGEPGAPQPTADAVKPSQAGQPLPPSESAARARARERRARLKRS
jgi:hypothetical protein